MKSDPKFEKNYLKSPKIRYKINKKIRTKTIDVEKLEKIRKKYINLIKNYEKVLINQ